MSIVDDYGNISDPSYRPPPVAPDIPQAGTGEKRKRGALTAPAPDEQPWAGGAAAAAARSNPSLDVWAKPPIQTAAANPANANAPGTRRIPDDRGFK